MCNRQTFLCTLSAFFYELLGLNANVAFHAPLAFGDEDDYLEKAGRQTESAVDYLVLLFSLATTPERENHGRLMYNSPQMNHDAERSFRSLSSICGF